MNISFVDLKAQYLSIKPEMDAAIFKVLDNTSFIGGEPVASFEKHFAELYGVKHCISVANGTDAIYITLKMLGIGTGDEVITVANSWISTSETITQVGAKPVFVDVDEYFTIDVNIIERSITKNTKAIIPVHLYGQSCDMGAILALADKYNLHVIEDCAQSHFSEFEGKRAGTMGIAGTFSFFPGKNLGAYGDAGAIITNDDELAKKCKMYANHGALKKHEHQIEGINSRLDALQAAILSVKLPNIISWTNSRIKNAHYYMEKLQDISDIELPLIRNNTLHSFHLFVIKVKKRQRLIEFLTENGIATAIHYPTPLPFMDAYTYLGYKEIDFPLVKSNQPEILSLPMFPELTDLQIDYIAAKIKEFYAIGW